MKSLHHIQAIAQALSPYRERACCCFESSGKPNGFGFPLLSVQGSHPFSSDRSALPLIGPAMGQIH
jgi:hypothetical protein